jgi:hypothetical protein
VGVALTTTGDNVEVWSQTYDRPAKDVLAVQDEITTAVAGALKIHLASGSIARTSGTDPETYDLYLRGQYYHNQLTKDGLDKAIDYYQEALRRDSTYAPAWAGLAWAYINMADGYQPPREVAPLMRAAAERAVALDDHYATGHAVLGAVWS